MNKSQATMDKPTHIEDDTALGIDVGGTNIRIGEISTSGTVLQHERIDVSRDRDQLLNQLVSLITRYNTKNVRAIGIGIPGRVDATNGKVVSTGYLPLQDFSLCAYLNAFHSIPIFMENDCSMALVGETMAGAAVGKSENVMFSIGTGIGGAVMHGGKLIHGNNFAGQFGHITVAADGTLCKCGRYGCIETFSSGSALKQLYAEHGVAPNTNLDEILQKATNGCPASLDLVKSWARPMRNAIQSVAAVLDPQAVILGGGIGGQMTRALSFVPEHDTWFHVSPVSAKLGDDAGIIGAGLHALTEYQARDV